MNQYWSKSTFPNPSAIKRPKYLPPIVGREQQSEWDGKVMERYLMLTTDIQLAGGLKVAAFNQAISGHQQKRIPDSDWHNICHHCLMVACYTYDRDKIQNITAYNERMSLTDPNFRPMKVPKSVCPLVNYFWKLLYFTSCLWYKKNQHTVNSLQYSENRS